MALFWQSPVGCLPHSEHKLHWLPFSWVARTLNSLLSCQIQAAAVTCCKSLTWNKLAQSVQGSCQQGGKNAAGLASCSRFHAWAGVACAAIAKQRSDWCWHQLRVNASLGLSPEGGREGRTGNILVLLPQEKKRRREENLKRRLENERKAEIVQVVSCSPAPGWGTLRWPGRPRGLHALDTGLQFVPVPFLGSSFEGYCEQHWEDWGNPTKPSCSRRVTLLLSWQLMSCRVG